MLTLAKRFETLNINALHMLLTLCGVLLAVQINYIQHGWINNDSVLYFEAAKLFVAGDWIKGFDLYPWPLYSLLIAGIHMLSDLSLQLSAQLLCVGFFGIATASFLKIIQMAGGGQSTLLAGALILFSSQYVVGDILPMLLRDQGFWAFFLTSLIFFIRFSQDHSHKDALLWQITAILATLFRVEAITYLIALPLILFFNHQICFTHRLKLFLKANSLIIVITLTIGLLLILGRIDAEYMGRLREVFSLNLYDQLTRQLFSRSDIMGSQVLGEYLDDFATESLLLTFIYVMIVKALSSSGLIASAMAIYTGLSRRKIMKVEAVTVLSSVMLIALVNMFLIITKTFVLSGRYVIALALIVMIFAAFGLTEVFKHAVRDSKKGRVKKSLIVLIIIVLTLGLLKNALPKRQGYNYEQDAVAWVRAHNTQHALVHYDSPRLRYYAGAPYIGRNDFWPRLQAMVKNQQVGNYRFLLVNIGQDDAFKEAYIKEELPEYKELQRFYESNRKKAVVVFGKDK